MNIEDTYKKLKSLMEEMPNIMRLAEPPKTFDFSTALLYMKKGMAVYRGGWNGIKLGRTMFVRLEKPQIDMTDVIKQPYFELYDFGEDMNCWKGWIPSIMDLLAEDWKIYEEDCEYES